MTKFRFTIPLQGADRKTIATHVAAALDTEAVYDGAPRYTYTAKEWKIRRESVLESPSLTLEKLYTVQKMLTQFSENDRFFTTGNMEVSVVGVSADDVERVQTVLKSKEQLIQRTIRTDGELNVRRDNSTLVMPFFPATLDADRLFAYLTFAVKLVEFASNLNYTTAKEKNHANEKYAMRCFLLRLGFVGDDTKKARKTLLAPLSGDSAYNGRENRKTS